MTATIRENEGHGCLVIDYVGEAAIGNQGNILNPEGVALLVTESHFWLTTAATAAATINIGHGVTGADDASLHGALPLNGGAGTAWMGFHPAVTQDAAELEVIAAGQFITFTTAAQSALPCVGVLYIKYIRCP